MSSSSTITLFKYIKILTLLFIYLSKILTVGLLLVTEYFFRDPSTFFMTDRELFEVSKILKVWIGIKLFLSRNQCKR